uniref:Uncharacterized protein n=1 Tax=Gloeothece verrucosa (strain PCC 7822) TaxID=497965 RepID=E0UP06_GLOV7|nr:hypothetical protein Cyan7822_6204 [Gloeothece verrucosa PCC 7822]
MRKPSKIILNQSINKYRSKYCGKFSQYSSECFYYIDPDDDWLVELKILGDTTYGTKTQNG